MIKTFILIMVLRYGASLTTVQMEFDNLSACDNALKTVKSNLAYQEVKPSVKTAVCVEKFKE